MRLQVATTNTEWLVQRNLAFEAQEEPFLSREAVTYCLVYLARRPDEVPVEVVEALARAGYLHGGDC